ncbi:MAG: hypothetical protein H0W02_23155 [Ktedonobacteraceae bacterium]|nr:hypothetical protein [Ktedonobacteraceae bacterium]
MATQEERVTALEQTFATFRKETAARTREIEENTTILLGIIRSQSQDIRRTFERLDIIEQRLDSMEQGLKTMEQGIGEVKVSLGEHTSLLTQILARLPKAP